MKKFLISGLLIAIFLNSFSQNLDLVVTAKGDSIACKIDSITESAIYLQVKTSGNVNWIQTIYNKEDVHLFEYGCIDPSKHAFKEGTSKINGPVQPVYPKKFPDKLKLETASQDELNFYLKKAKKTKKTGAVLSIAGPVSIASGFLLGSLAWSGGTEGMWSAGLFLMFAGTGATLVGLPVLITGSSRVNTINKIMNSDRFSLELGPCNFYTYQAQNHQPGVTLKIKF